MEYMDRYQLNEQLIEKLRSKLKVKLGNATANEQKDARKLRAYVEELTERQNALVKKNFDGFIGDSVLKQQLDLIEREMTDTQINLASIQEMEFDFDELLGYAENYLKKPSIIWKEAKLEKRVKLQWFQFPQGIVLKNEKFETAQIASVFKTKEEFLPLRSAMVDPSGLEPLAS